MCNLYNITTTHEAMRRLFKKFSDLTNRVDPQMDIFPDYPAPVLRNIHGDDPELAMLRWGMPTPPMYMKGEADPKTKRKPLHWFALNEEKPLFAFAGIWTSWKGVRKKKDVPVEVDIFGFLKTEPNTVVKSVHLKVMPVILRTTEEIDTGLRAPTDKPRKCKAPTRRRSDGPHAKQRQ